MNHKITLSCSDLSNSIEKITTPTRISSLFTIFLTLFLSLTLSVGVWGQAVTSISPSSGPIAGGTAVIFQGTFPNQTTYTVKFDGTTVSANRENNNQLSATTPAHAAGLVNVIVYANNVAINNTVTYTYTNCTTPTISGGPTTFCAGGSVVLTSSSASGNQWHKDGVLISGATNQAYTATTAGSYTVIVTTSGCSSIASAATVVTINNITGGFIAKGAVQPGPGCGTLDPGITAVTTAAIGSATPTYIWQQSTNGGSTWTTIPSETAAQINPASFTVTTSFKRIATSTLNSVACSAESNVLEYVVNPIPTVNSITPGGTVNVCVNNTLQMSNSTVGGVWGTTTPSLVSISSAGLVTGLSEGTAAITYTVTDVNGCSKTANKNINVYALPTAPTAGNVTTTYDGTLKTGSATVAGGEVIDWYTLASGGAATVAPSGTNAGTYTAWAEARNTSTGCKSASRTQVTVQINKASATLTLGNLSHTYDGTAKVATVTTTPSGLTGISISGNSGNINAGSYPVEATLVNDNYVATPVSGNVVIGQAAAVITVTPYTVTYDGLAHTSAFTAVGVEATPVDLTGLMDVSGTTQTDAGTYNGAAWSFAGNNNYASTSGTVNNAIEQKPITGNFTAGNKIYDGNIVAAILTRKLNDVVGLDVVSLIGGTATFSDKNVDNGKTVTFNMTGASLSGAQSGNYSLTSVGTTTANITAKALTAATTVTKVYDGTTSVGIATLGTVTGLIGSETLSITPTHTTLYSSANVGNAYAATVSYALANLTGLAANYSMADLVINNAAITALSVSSSVTVSSPVQYSDQATFTATITGGYIGGIKAAAGVTFIVGTQEMNATPIFLTASGSNLIATLTAPLLETVAGQMAPDVNKTVSAIFNDVNSNYTVSPNPATTGLTIIQENAWVDYTGDVMKATANASTRSAKVILRANIFDISATGESTYDAYPGDIRNAKVKFVNRDNGIGISDWIPVNTLLNTSDTKVGTVSYEHTVYLPSNEDYVFLNVGIIVDDGYYIFNNSVDYTVVTVYLPVGDFITGGGYIVPTQSIGSKDSTPGKKVNFGFNVKFNKTGKNLKGNMNIIFRRLESDGIVHSYQIKANAMQSLGVNASIPASQTAEYVSKTNLTDITNPLSPVSMGGNNYLYVKMTDNGEPGLNDMISFVLVNGDKDPTIPGNIIFSSNWVAFKTEQMKLAGGNLKVHSGFSTINARTDETATTNVTAVEAVAEVVELGIFTVKAYPNPSNNYFRLQLSGVNPTEAVELNVFDVNGRHVYSKKGNAFNQYQFGEQLKAGVYFIDVRAGDQSDRIKVIKH